MRLRATGQTLELVESERLVSGSVEIYTAAFEFDPAWDGYAKTAVFTDDMGRSAEIALTDNTCTVPWEILRAGRYIHIGIYGVNGDKRYPTIYTANGLRVFEGALPANPSQPPSPTEYEQLLSMIGDTAALKTTDKSSLCDRPTWPERKIIMKHLYEYINEIMDIAAVNHVEPQNAKDMFLANVRNAGDPTLPHYRGAGDVDYAALAEDLPRLTREGAALAQAVFDHYSELVELRGAGRYAEAVELMRGAVEAESNGLCDDDE